MTEPFGFLNLNKSPGMTSHDVVAKIRRTFRLKKVGHAGTLDPLATGVLIVCIGGATRLSEYVMHQTKVYRAEVCLGVTTDTYDAEGTVTAQSDVSHLQQADVAALLQRFQGTIQQIPPLYSAIKHEGRKLYDIARAGETLELDAREVVISELELERWAPPHMTLRVVCSPGTYIRSLAFDIGQCLGVGAHLSGLVRLGSGGFMLDTAVALDALVVDTDWPRHLIAAQTALADWPSFVVDESQAHFLRQGKMLPDASAVDGTLALAYDAANQLVAVVEARGGLWKPHKVFS